MLDKKKKGVTYLYFQANLNMKFQSFTTKLYSKWSDNLKLEGKCLSFSGYDQKSG